MKLLLTAIALAISVPAAAQTGAPAQSPAQSAPAQPAPHADHAMPGMNPSMNHADHDDCCEMKSSDGKAMDCCEKMKAKDGKMDCCEKMKAGHKATDPHAGHDMNSH